MRFEHRSVSHERLPEDETVLLEVEFGLEREARERSAWETERKKAKTNLSLEGFPEKPDTKRTETVGFGLGSLSSRGKKPGQRAKGELEKTRRDSHRPSSSRARGAKT